MVMDTWRHKPCICEYPTYCRAARVIIKSTLVILTYWNGFCWCISRKGSPENFHQLHTHFCWHMNRDVSNIDPTNLSASMKSNKFLLAIWVISQFLRFLVVLPCEMSTVWGHAWCSWWSGDCQMIIDFSISLAHLLACTVTCGSDIDILYCYNSSTCQASWKLREAWDLL